MMAEVDGDKSLVVADKNIISVAERNGRDIVPLYYNMKKAHPSLLNNQAIYDGLSRAFTGGNIGVYSNNISKIWNDEVFISGTEEEKQEALNCIKCLCAQNNYVIDYAKTLYKPEFPDNIKIKITSYTKKKLPHFFVYAKDKAVEQVEDVNGSFVNKLSSLIPNPRISYKNINGSGGKKKLGKPDVEFMMSDPDFELKEEYVQIYDKYIELSRKYRFKIDATSVSNLSSEVLMKSQIRHKLLFNEVVENVKRELSLFGYPEDKVVDVLVARLYSKSNNSKYKDLLWICYGKQILDNLKRNFKYSKKAVQCIDCGEWFEVDKYNSATCRCNECQKERNKINARIRKREQRKREKQESVTLPFN